MYCLMSTMLKSNCLACNAATTTATICCDRLICPDCYQRTNICPGCRDKRMFNTRVESKSYFKNDGTYQCACGASGPQSQWERHFSTHVYRKPVQIKSCAPSVKSGQNATIAIGYSKNSIGQNSIAIGARQGQTAIAIGSVKWLSLLKGKGGRL